MEILDPDDKLFPELAATVHFLPFKTGAAAETSKAYLFVPKAAVFQENGHDYVWVVGKKSQVNKRQVEVATTKEDLARVESGLESGETRGLESSENRSKKMKRSGSPNDPCGAERFLSWKRKVIRSWARRRRSSCVMSTKSTAGMSS